MRNAEQNIKIMEEAIGRLPKWEQEEIQKCITQIERMRLQYGSSAELAIVLESMKISQKEGQ